MYVCVNYLFAFWFSSVCRVATRMRSSINFANLPQYYCNFGFGFTYQLCNITAVVLQFMLTPSGQDIASSYVVSIRVARKHQQPLLNSRHLQVFITEHQICIPYVVHHGALVVYL